MFHQRQRNPCLKKAKIPIRMTKNLQLNDRKLFVPMLFLVFESPILEYASNLSLIKPIIHFQIIDQANDLQKQIIQTNPLLSKASVTIPTLHVTLLVFALKNEEDKTR